MHSYDTDLISVAYAQDGEAHLQDSSIEFLQSKKTGKLEPNEAISYR